MSVRLTMATIEVWRAGFHADQRAELGAITIPVLIVHGTADQLNADLVDFIKHETRSSRRRQKGMP